MPACLMRSATSKIPRTSSGSPPANSTDSGPRATIASATRSISSWSSWREGRLPDSE